MLSLIAPLSFAQHHISTLMIVCPSLSNDDRIPDFKDPNCEESSFYTLKPQNRQIWVKANLVYSPDSSIESKPMALFWAGKASSHIYLNGTLVAKNGDPSTDKKFENPGKMDFVAYVAPSLLRQGNNELVLRMSAHHGFLNLGAPLHQLYIDDYSSPKLLLLKHYWPSLIPLGILLLGAAYFGILGLKLTRPAPYFFLPMTAVFSAGQLCVEVMRAFYTYAYPFHDVRLVLILLMSLGFGLCLFGYILYSLNARFGRLLFAGIIVLTLTAIFTVQGFDYKSAIALGFPCIASLVVSCLYAFKKRTNAPILAAALLIYISTLIWAPNDFLDIYFFYFVSAFVFFLFIQQLKISEEERLESAQEKARADKLQLIIDQNQSQEESRSLTVRGASTTELVKISNIAICKGAGDYVELILTNKRTILHNETLAELENILPSSFLRVHRSYIVNTSLIEKIERKKSGVGVLTLTDAGTIPVSRRIMPSVRERVESIAT